MKQFRSQYLLGHPTDRSYRPPKRRVFPVILANAGIEKLDPGSRPNDGDLYRFSKVITF